MPTTVLTGSAGDDDLPAPRVFISYAHASREHTEAVRLLGEILRQVGVDARLDLDEVGSRRDWSTWMTQQVLSADFVIVIASGAYRRVADGEGDPGRERGVQYESGVIREMLYRDRSFRSRVLPVVLPGESVDAIPLYLSPFGSDHFIVSDISASGLVDLIGTIFGRRAAVAPPPLKVERASFERAVEALKAYVTQAGLVAPSCFISYSWGNPVQERWVQEQFAEDLSKAGIAVILDKWENATIGKSLARFVEIADDADRIVVVGTPMYRTKYINRLPMGRAFVVAAEGDLINLRMTGTEAEKDTVLPILLEGDPDISFPPLLRGRVWADYRDPTQYFQTTFDLLLSLFGIPPRRWTELRRQFDYEAS